MIRINSITINNLRGIRHFTRSLGGLSLVIQGPNGSGKSGVIDAIEFGLTGSISRLTGSGTKSLTPKQHGKHVGAKEGTVSLAIHSTEQGRDIVVTRSTQNPSKPKIEPDDERSQALLREISGHPEIALTRRQIIRFILAEAKDRSTKLQALLRLEKIEHVCDELKKARSKCERTRITDESTLEEKQKLLRAYLEVAELTDGAILASINQRHNLLGLDSVIDLNSYLVASSTSSKSATREINKKELFLDIKSLRDTIASEELGAACTSILEQLAALDADESLALALSRHQLIGFGLAAIDADECPLCDTEWDMAKLREHLLAKLSQCEAAKQINAAISTARDDLTEQLSGIIASLKQFGFAARRLQREDLVVLLKAEFEKIAHCVEQFKTQDGLEAAREWLTDSKRFSSLVDAVTALELQVEKIPDQSEQDQAKQFLSDAVRMLKELRIAESSLKRSTEISELATCTYETFQKTAEEVLNQLYDTVKADFESSYRFINDEDENDFESEFITSENSLEIKAKFYNHGNHPPAAYHSEGHQDGMGLCLYLALMNQVFAGDLQLVILDDVVMSIDNGHRKKLCELLRTKYPNTQFIITTHERTWFKQMQTAKLITPKSAIQFSGWTVAHGPQVFTAVETWDEIEAALQKDDIGLAAWRLRNHLEYLSSDLADELGADVAYRADGFYSVGELFPRVCQRFRSLLKQSAKASKSWGHNDKYDEARQLEGKFKDLFARIEQQESWMVNPAIHHNPWQDFTRQEFTQVVRAYRELLDCLMCRGCKTTVRRNSAINCTDISCMCGRLQFRLLEATAGQKADREASEAKNLRLHAP
jgi:DNA repair exonuclease SbcCD ATPase subunit